MAQTHNESEIMVPLLEIIATTEEDARNAIAGGADSLEIIHDLSVGGLTPDIALVRNICEIAPDAEKQVILRPHARDFQYSSQELDSLCDFIDQVKKYCSISTFVFGALTADSRVDHAVMAQIIDHAYPVPFTFHRAIDYSITVEDDLEKMHPGVIKILASGMTQDVWSGRETLKKWVSSWGSRYKFVCAGGVTLENIADLATITGADVLHMGRAVRKNDIVDTELVRTAKQNMLTADRT